MNPWDRNNNNDIDNMTTYLSATMFQMRIDPNAQANPASMEHYEKDVDETNVKQEEAATLNGGSEEEEAKEKTEDSATPDDPAAPEVKEEPAKPVAEANSKENNPGVTAPSPAVPAGVPTAHMTPAPVSLPAQAAGNEPVIEERGEVSMLYVGRVIGKGGEVSCF
jgi:hypothetical protein